VIYTGTGAFKGPGDGVEQMVAAYSLARFGHESVYLLDGGLDKWKEEKRPLSKLIPTVEESDFRALIKRDYFLEHEELKAMKDRDDAILLDTRPPVVYEGQGLNIKPGHIPGAVNLPWQRLMDGKNRSLLRPYAEIKAILDAAGISPEKTVICSCGTGRGATCLFLILRSYLGYPNVKIYEGSFLEWCSYPENPTVTGKRPR
jgi:thiosulfate/3-mercaptopyruvate sulfurtransferase